MKRSRLFLLALCLILLLGCTPVREAPATGSQPASSQPASESAEPTTQPTEPTTLPTEPTTLPTEPPTQPTTIPTEPPTEPTTAPTVPPVLYWNPLTGEALAEASDNRLFAVVLNNIKAAQPQYGVGKADLLIETLAEGGVTRCLGIYHDITDVSTLGSIRSARKYFVELAQGFDALLVHAGGSSEANAYISSIGWNNLDGVKGSGASSYFYRDQDRLDAGYSLEHTMFIRPESIFAYAKKLGYTTTVTGGVDLGWQFGDSSALTGEAATQVTVHFGSSTNNKSTSFVYDAETGLYAASQYGSAYMDAAEGTQITFRNILVLKTGIVNQGDASGHLTITTVGSGTGYYICGGKLISIRWSRESSDAPFVFTTGDGETLTFGVGKTYMAIVPTNARFLYS